LNTTAPTSFPRKRESGIAMVFTGIRHFRH